MLELIKFIRERNPNWLIDNVPVIGTHASPTIVYNHTAESPQVFEVEPFERVNPAPAVPDGFVQIPEGKLKELLEIAEKALSNPKTERVDSILDNSDAIIRRSFPLWDMIGGAIRRVIPHGWGTRLGAFVLIVASIASYLGYPVPIVNVPQDLSGMGGVLGITLWFLRNAVGK